MNIVLESYGGKSRSTFPTSGVLLDVLPNEMLKSFAAKTIDKFGKLCKTLLNVQSHIQIIFGIGACVDYKHNKESTFAVINCIPPSFAESINSPKHYFDKQFENNTISINTIKKSNPISLRLFSTSLILITAATDRKAGWSRSCSSG